MREISGEKWRGRVSLGLGFFRQIAIHVTRFRRVTTDIKRPRMKAEEPKRLREARPYYLPQSRYDSASEHAI